MNLTTNPAMKVVMKVLDRAANGPASGCPEPMLKWGAGLRIDWPLHRLSLCSVGAALLSEGGDVPYTLHQAVLVFGGVLVGGRRGAKHAQQQERH